MDYLTWNEEIAAHFFNERMAGRKVYLYVTEELLEEIGKPHGCSLIDFIAAVKKGYGLAVAKKNVCDAAHAWVRINWEKLDQALFKYPPYIAYLALFVLAAGHGDEGEYHPNTYYQRLNDLLGADHETVNSQNFSKLDKVWDDLERWSNESQQGRLGLFNVHVAGRCTHVGIPIAQTLLTEKERDDLKQIFASAGLSPMFPPSDEELAALVLARGKYQLRPRTVRLLEGDFSGDPGFRDALLEAIADALEHWDGTVKTCIPAATGTTPQHFSGTLVLNLTFSPFGDVEHVQLRCTCNRDFPEDALDLAIDGKPGMYTCTEYRGGWSTPISTPEGKPLDAATIDWADPPAARDSEKNWTFRMPPSRTRIFVDGPPLGLPGFVETRQIPLGVRVLVAVHRDKQAAFEAWGRDFRACEGFKIAGTHGLPPGWKLYEVAAIHDTAAIQADLPALSLPAGVRLSLAGGIRHNRPDEFFSFAPPVIQVRSMKPVQVYCNGIELQPGDQAGLYPLSQELLQQHALVIEVHQEGKVVKTRRLFLHNQFPWPDEASYQQFDAFGQPVEKEGVAGTLVTGWSGDAFHFNTYTQLPAFESRRVFLIGRKPGQIVSWPIEELPGWDIVWAVPMERSGRAVYCGSKLPGPAPVRDSKHSDKKRRREWHKVLFVWRKRIQEPEHPELRRLWREYQEVAKYAR